MRSLKKGDKVDCHSLADGSVWDGVVEKLLPVNRVVVSYDNFEGYEEVLPMEMVFKRTRPIESCSEVVM